MRRPQAETGSRSRLIAGAGIAGGIALVGLGAAVLRRRAAARSRVSPVSRVGPVGRVSAVGRLSPVRLQRGLAALQLVARGGMRYAGSAPRLFAAAGEQRQQLRHDLALETAEDVAQTLGAMKGV